MSDAKELVSALISHGVHLFTGVPDSLLTKFSACIMQMPNIRHIITANEGNAIGLAIGEYLSTTHPAVIYMQNSGLGNIVNPITSLADPQVYSIPMFLVIGWRGEPGVHDEPQHIKQGAITLNQLDVLGIPYLIFDPNSNAVNLVGHLWEIMISRKGPVALVIRKGSITGDWKVTKEMLDASLKREDAIETLINVLPHDSFYVATTGKTGRELFEIRNKKSQPQRDFLTVGGMGHASSIAAGIALNRPDKLVVCLDGDGAMLMHLGALATIGDLQPKNFIHILLNNGAHESVGGQPTVAKQIDFKSLSHSVGYNKYICCRTTADIQSLSSIINTKIGPALIEIKLLQGARKDLGRPTRTPIQNKNSVMSFLQK